MSTVIDGSASVTINSGAILGITSGTAVTLTTQTSVDFTSIPSWVKRLTVMFSGVSTNGTSAFLIQLGDAGGIETTGYVSYSCRIGAASLAAGGTNTSGFVVNSANSAAATVSGQMMISHLGSNSWTEQGMFGSSTDLGLPSGGGKTLSDTLTQVRITTVNGTDTFDAGTVNILYE
jgi:hypothetical protein